MDFLANKLGNRTMVWFGGFGFVLSALRYALAYPSLIRETPMSFGEEHLQEVIGI